MTSKWTMPAFVLLLIATAIGLYFNSLTVPFYLDDEGSIISNPNFVDASFASLWQAYGLRVVGYITLWWDFQAVGLETTRYHVVNIAIHAINGLLVFALSRQILSLATDKATLPASINWMAFIVALLFISHPLHTQAVTYVVQRLASLVTLFYLLSLCSYIAFRQTEQTFARVGWLLLCAAAALLAVFTKQNAFTLFGVIVLIELLFFFTLTMKRALILAVAAGFSVIAVLLAAPDVIQQIDMLTRENRDMTRWDYFTTQLSVLWVYIGKVFWPYPLMLEYPFKIGSFSTTQTMIAGAAHLALIGFALWAKRLSPVITFGVGFYYIAHLIESGVIPITDIAFEHRTYLPDVGLMMAVVALIGVVLTRLPRYQRVISASLVLAIVVPLSYLTVQRNAQWNDPTVFYAHELKHNPSSARVLHEMAKIHYQKGELNTALAHMDRLYDSADGTLDGIMVNTHLAILISARKYQEGLQLGEKLLQKTLHPSARAAVHSNLGVIYANLQQFGQAAAQFKQAEQYGVVPINGSIAYGYSLFVTDQLSEAMRVVQSILMRVPDQPKALQLQQMIAEKQG
ncbi:tetratricopeptide repeat protein [Aestuariibacter salexigens]|uniref:tetratricopeptide repeat protein n=1 Tax=Aestuariibacter salexigens TaxID=226010 RepID=UPI00041AA1B6|nr:hypothetical protein [Aestuariibacter salexigens]